MLLFNWHICNFSNYVLVLHLSPWVFECFFAHKYSIFDISMNFRGKSFLTCLSLCRAVFTWGQSSHETRNQLIFRGINMLRWAYVNYILRKSNWQRAIARGRMQYMCSWLNRELTNDTLNKHVYMSIYRRQSRRIISTVATHFLDKCLSR